MAHFVGGLWSGVLAMIGYGVFSALFVVLFLVYEMNEDWHISDEAFVDICEFMIGMFVGSIIGIIIWRW